MRRVVWSRLRQRPMVGGLLSRTADLDSGNGGNGVWYRGLEVLVPVVVPLARCRLPQSCQRCWHQRRSPRLGRRRNPSVRPNLKPGDRVGPLASPVGPRLPVVRPLLYSVMRPFAMVFNWNAN